MALNIYVDTEDIPKSLKVIRFNDNQFDYDLDSMKIDKNIEKLMYIIDGSRYIPDGNGSMRTRYGDLLKLSYLSTGCKTAINIYNHPNEIVDCIECGDNAINEILSLNRGNIIGYGTSLMGGDKAIDVNMIYKGKIYKFSSLKKLVDFWMKI